MAFLIGTIEYTLFGPFLWDNQTLLKLLLQAFGWTLGRIKISLRRIPRHAALPTPSTVLELPHTFL